MLNFKEEEKSKQIHMLHEHCEKIRGMQTEFLWFTIEDKLYYVVDWYDQRFISIVPSNTLVRIENKVIWDIGHLACYYFGFSDLPGKTLHENKVIEIMNQILSHECKKMHVTPLALDIQKYILIPTFLVKEGEKHADA